MVYIFLTLKSCFHSLTTLYTFSHFHHSFQLLSIESNFLNHSNLHRDISTMTTTTNLIPHDTPSYELNEDIKPHFHVCGWNRRSAYGNTNSCTHLTETWSQFWLTTYFSAEERTFPYLLRCSTKMVHLDANLANMQNYICHQLIRFPFLRDWRTKRIAKMNMRW